MTRSSVELIRRVEEAKLNAWPPIQQVLFDGWLLRFSGSYSKRGNAVVPLYPGTQRTLQKIRHCEEAYSRKGLPTLFQLSNVPELRSLDRALADSRYKRIDSSLVLTVGLDELPATSGRLFEVLEIDSWLNVYCHLSGMPKTAARLQQLVLKSIPADAIYGAIKSSAGHVACGLAVIDDKFIGLFDILTHPNYRRQGHARQLILNLLRCGTKNGAHTGYLQVAKDNKPALALYKHMGFQSLYRSWYRLRQGLETRSVDSA